jgi:PST family polysaccharide transporter
MQFFSLARANICSEVFSTGGVLLLQCRIDPVVALASKNLIYGLVQFVCVYAFSAKTEFGAPKPSIDFSGARRILWFSTYQFSFSFVNYFSRNLDNVLVGRVMGAASLGVYDKAYQLMKYPLMLLTFGMTPAIQPALAKHTGDAKSCERIHRDFVKRLSWIGIVAALFVVLGASTIVRVILGPKWQPVTPIIRQLGLGVGPQVVLSTIGSFFQAMQRPDLLFGTGMASCLMIVSAIAIGIWKSDLVLMAWLISTAFNASFLLAYFVLYTFVFRVSPQRFYRQLRLQIASNVSILILGSPFTSRMAHEICAYIQSS